MAEVECSFMTSSRRNRLEAFLCCAVLLLLVSIPSRAQQDQAPPDDGAARAPSALIAQIQAWKAAGGVVDPHQLGPKPPTPDTANAADIHEKVMPVLDNYLFLSGIDVSEPWNLSEDDLKDAVEPYRSKIHLIRQAANAPYCNWGITYNDPANRRLDYLSYCRHAAVLLNADAVLKAKRGDYKGAADELCDALKVSEQVTTDSLSIGVLVCIATDRLVQESTEKIFNGHGDLAIPILEILAQRKYREKVHRGILSDGTELIVFYRKAAGCTDFSMPIGDQAMSEATANELVWLLKMYAAYAEKCRQPIYLSESLPKLPPRPPASGVISEEFIFNPAGLNRLYKTASSSQNDTLLAQTVLQALKYHKEHGVYPDVSLIQLPIDEVTGKPVTYSPKGNGFVASAPRLNPIGDKPEFKWVW